MPKNLVLVFCDRDGTLVADEPGQFAELRTLLGASPNWRKQIEFLPGVVEGIKTINLIPNTRVVIVSNQTGVALADQSFCKLTEQRVWEVDYEIRRRLAHAGARIDASFYSFYLPRFYANHLTSRGYKVLPEYVQDGHPMRKPEIGMLRLAAISLGVQLEEVPRKFMIGDRLSDMETASKANCTPFFIDSPYSYDFLKPDIKEAIARLPYPVLLVSNFLEAARKIKALVFESRP